MHCTSKTGAERNNTYVKMHSRLLVTVFNPLFSLSLSLNFHPSPRSTNKEPATSLSCFMSSLFVCSVISMRPSSPSTLRRFVTSCGYCDTSVFIGLYECTSVCVCVCVCVCKCLRMITNPPIECPRTCRVKIIRRDQPEDTTIGPKIENTNYIVSEWVSNPI